MAEAFAYRTSSSGTARQLSVYLDASSTASQVILGLYTNGNGHPARLLAQGLTNHPTKGAWNSVTIPATNLSPGTRYWIAILAPSGAGAIQFRDRSTGGINETSAQANLTTLPRTWSTGALWSNTPASAFASP